jgi:hypothetical protein
MAAKSNDIAIPIFDGIEFSNWKIRILKYLQFKKCSDVATRAKISTDDEKWDERDIQATNYIYSAISNKQLEYVCELNSAYEIMKKFDEMYIKKSTALQIVCRHNLESVKLKNYSEVNLFFDDFERQVNELKQAGAVVSETEKLNYMLKSLPQTYSHIGDLIDVLPEEQRTVDYLKSKIKLKSVEEKSEGDNNNSSHVFKANTKFNKDRKCFQCGKTGHLKRECRNQNSGVPGRGYVFGGRGFAGQRGRGSYDGHFQRGRGRNSAGHGSSFYTTIANTSTVYQSERSSNGEIEWLLDSGCTDHIINTDEHYDACETLNTPVKVRIGDGTLLEATKVGNITAYFPVYGNNSQITLKNVFFVREMKANLLSYSKITDQNTITSKGYLTKIYNANRELIAIAKKENHLYRMKCFVNKEIRNNMTSKLTAKEKLHRIFGHVNFNCLNIMCKEELLDGLPKQLETEYLKCKICLENKMHNLPFKNDRRGAQEILEIVHSDVNGPHRTTGNNGEKYFVSFIDDYSKLAKVYCIQTKDQVKDCFETYVNEVQNLTGKTVKTLRCDNGTEYLNNGMYNFARKKGIIIKTCPPYVHELNGTAERFNRSIMDMSRCLMAEAKVDRRYWPEVVKAAAYIKNRTLTNTIEKKTPYEIFFKQKLSAKNLRLYGSKVFVRIPEEKRKSKWDKKAEQGVLIGYSDVGYRVLINGKVMVARHVDIVEEDVECIGFEDDENQIETDDRSKEEKKDTKSNEVMQETTESEEICDISIEQEETYRRPRRKIKTPMRFDEEYGYYCIAANYCDATNPVSYQEAIQSEDCDQWTVAMNREMDCLVKNDTWTLIDKPQDKKVLDVKWVYKKKSPIDYKARLVVRGFQQTDHVDDVYSPVAKMETLKLLLSCCCQMGMVIHQMDVETAFLNGKVVSEVYVKQPFGFDDCSGRVYKLNKALYGLKESPRLWYECFNDYITTIGFRRSKFDNCLYVKVVNEVSIYIILFVDDLLICCKNENLIVDVKYKLCKKFKIKDMDVVKNYIGIDIQYDYSQTRTVTMSQESYIESLAKRYKIENCKLYKTPLEINLKLDKCDINEDVKYRNLIGALLYISGGTRPDIAYSVNYMSRFQNCYNDTHFKYALRVLKYLYLTKGLKLTYKENSESDIMDCFVDADWAGDTCDRKSTTGFIIRLFGNVIYWKSKKQNSVTKSSTFAEYVALSEAVSEIILLRNIVNDIFIKIDKPTNVYEDNSGALNIAKCGNFTKNSKHIEVQYHYVNESYINKIIDIVKIDTENNIADLFTKSLGRVKFDKYREMLNLI